MKSATIPTGPRNPNGYTESEVLRAIRGVDGYRELSFRYELLDQHLNYKRDLDNILGGSVQMHYVSQIKATADFQMVDGADINWLDDHIKPYIRLKMPPKIVKDGIVLDTLWENGFDGPNGVVLTPANSVAYGSPVSSTDGMVRYSTAWSAVGSASCRMGTDDGTGESFGSGRITLNFRSRRTWRMSFYMNIPVGSSINVGPDGLRNDDRNYLRFDDIFQNWNLGSVDITAIKGNLVGRPVRVEIVNDGLRCRYSLWWTNWNSPGDADYTVSEDSSQWDPTQVCSISGGGFGRTPSHIDEIRVSVPNPPEYIPRTVPVWHNTFNNDPSEYVDIQSLRYSGNTPDETRGYLAYDDTWSVDNSGSSLRLGSNSVTGASGSGAIQVSVPPRGDWNLKMWANIPHGGKLYVAPSPEEYVPSPDEAPPWAGPIERIGTLGSNGAWNSTTTAERPSGTQQGDYILAAVTTNGAGSLNEPEAPWERLGYSEFGEHTRIWIFGKEAGSSEPSHYQFTFDQEHWHSSFVTVVRNTEGIRQISINSGEGVTSMDTPVLGAIDGDALFVIGFDWDPVNKQWNDPGTLTTELHQNQGMIVSSMLGLPTDPTPSYTLTTDAGTPSRMAAVSVVFASIPDPQNPDPYPGEIQFIESSQSAETWTTVNTVPVPAGTAQGDYMISVLSANSFDNLTPASGWDLLGSASPGDGTSVYFYGRFAGSSEPASYDWTWDGEHWHRGSCTSWRNVLGVREVATDAGEDVNSLWLPTVVANTGDTLLAAGFDWGANGKNFEDDGAMTILVNQDGEGGVLASQQSLEAGESPSYEFTSDAPAPTRLAVATIVLEAYQDPGSQPGPFRGPNWIVLDDEGGEYSIAGTDVSHEDFRNILFGTPIRIEMETTNGEYFWRIYSTDPMGDAPDINWFGNSSDWGPLAACLFQGGGETAQPAMIDNVTLGRTIPVERPTPDSTNYVEFPMGVFLMASPTRSSDEDGVVTRDVEAYDRTKLFVDDKLTERMTIPKGTVYTDVINDLLGDIPKIVEPSDWVAGRDREFAVGTSLKEVIDAIAEGINYNTLRFDEEGRAVVQRYVNPTNRAPEYHYQDDEISIMYPDVEVEFDAFDIANVFITSVSEADGDPIYVKLENNDPANPFSIPRRGRRIVDFRQEETTTDKATLLRKAKRIQFESNRLYENVSFNTLINPLHWANDCYNITYGPLAVNEKYTELNWEIPLEAGATMTHTARRVVKLDAEQDEGFIENHLEVIGSLTAGNIKWGRVTIDHGAGLNRPLSVSVTGLDLKGSGPVQVFVTPVTTAPGTSVRQATTQNESPDGFEVWATRRTNFVTTYHWLAMRSL